MNEVIKSLLQQYIPVDEILNDDYFDHNHLAMFPRGVNYLCTFCKIKSGFLLTTSKLA